MAAVKLVSSIEGPEDAPVLVLGNPIGTNRDVWSHQLPVLSRYFRVLRYNPRGHGAPGDQSPAPPGPYTIADLGGDVLALADAHGIERFAYAGVSLGGMTGIWLAATAPERVASLAVCCAALTALPSPQAWHDRAALVRAEGMAPLADLVVPRWFTPAFMAREPAAVQTVTDMLTATRPEGYAGCGEAIAALDLRPLLPSVQAPTLVLSGARGRRRAARDRRRHRPGHPRRPADRHRGRRALRPLRAAGTGHRRPGRPLHRHSALCARAGIAY